MKNGDSLMIEWLELFVLLFLSFVVFGLEEVNWSCFEVLYNCLELIWCSVFSLNVLFMVLSFVV